MVMGKLGMSWYKKVLWLHVDISLEMEKNDFEVYK